MGGKNSAAGAEQTALNNQANVQGNILNQANQLANTNSQYYQSPLAGEASGYTNSVNAISPGLASGYSTLLGSGGNMSSQTGINTNQLGQNLTNYASNTGSTNLAQANPALSSFYTNEMQNGINPQYAQNAQSQVAQTAAQQLSDARSQAAPGQNMNALQTNIQNQTLANSANLAGNLAGQNQSIMQQGAQGLANTASSLDTQKLGMLTSALSGGQSVNQNALQNLISALTSGQTGLNNATSFTGQGQSGLTSGMGAEAGVAGNDASQAANFGQQAQSQQGAGGLLGSILGTVGNVATGGMSGAITSGLSGLFGGGLSAGDGAILSDVWDATA